MGCDLCARLSGKAKRIVKLRRDTTGRVLKKRFGRDASNIETVSPHTRTFDERNTGSQAGCTHCSNQSSWAGTDYHQMVFRSWFGINIVLGREERRSRNIKFFARIILLSSGHHDASSLRICLIFQFSLKLSITDARNRKGEQKSCKQAHIKKHSRHGVFCDIPGKQ